MNDAIEQDNEEEEEQECPKCPPVGAHLDGNLRRYGDSAHGFIFNPLC